MTGKKATRAANGRSSIYLGADGYWHGRVSMGIKADGKPDRRHVKRREYDDVIEAVQELESQRKNGTARKPGRAALVSEWLIEWVEEISAPTVRYRTTQGYRVDVHNHLIPTLGTKRVNQVTAKDFERLYAELRRKGLKPGTVHHVHRTAKTAWREAKLRKLITEQPFDLVKPPTVEESEVEPYEIEEIRAVMEAALRRRNGVRFILALALGVRKGECLGFRWSRLNRTTKVLRVSKQRQRQTYEHGCADPVGCAVAHCKSKPCTKKCKRHKKCPPPCPPGCVRHAMHCPERIGGLMEVDVKSAAGRRGLRLPDELFKLLMTHKEQQEKEKETAGDLWQGEDFMFAQANGKALDPRSDHNEWKALLADAGVRDARLHDARHTAATVLLLLGVPERAVMSFMGWSSTKMTARYQHITAALQNSVASQINGFLWKPNETPN